MKSVLTVHLVRPIYHLWRMNYLILQKTVLIRTITHRMTWEPPGIARYGDLHGVLDSL